MWVGTRDFSGEWTNKSNYSVDEEKYMGLTVLCNINAWVGICMPIQVKAGDVFTFSCFIKSSGDATTTKAILYGNPYSRETENHAKIKEHGKWVTVTSEWQHFSSPITVTSEGNIKVRIETETSDAHICLCGFKLERGINPNPIWTPNHEEVIYTKSELQTFLDDYMKTKTTQS